MGHPVHHSFLREIVDEIRKPRTIDSDIPIPPLGKHWVSRFLARNPSLQSKVAKSIEAARKEITEEQLVKWFDKFKHVIEQYDIRQENIYNMDKTG